MAFEQYFMQEWKSLPSVAKDSEKTSPCFDCSICLDFARDPVVTLCGHLYCWPCIYKWFQSASLESDQHLPRCPVCKTEISDKTMVPLYGRGQCLSETEDKGENIPPRPPARSTQDLYNSSDPYPGNEGDPSSQFDLSHPGIGMYGEMVYARVFGNSESLYWYPNSYHLVGNSSPRLRRQQLQANKSLNRISIFLFCCYLLCLLLF
ncbi:E3 ubiquitin-protein ligase RMA1H1-like [Olea europaea var. sylvestris]|uniref:E3 ubiquitin-protein ligase RMA n=1 Tax=Olea europaea subsp. europaea TaxID=158383 RepID=A0A8S0RKN1_OLEEU|nr:E3 ubiquitin-protein ligase RMA1H1-like [Olea europaea var. sylvestris]CAA2979645.1 E3 ubiquitin- ligase RMA1H1-like [Olea europaea subsp. europaea]